MRKYKFGCLKVNKYAGLDNVILHHAISQPMVSIGSLSPTRSTDHRDALTDGFLKIQDAIDTADIWYEIDDTMKRFIKPVCKMRSSAGEVSAITLLHHMTNILEADARFTSGFSKLMSRVSTGYVPFVAGADNVNYDFSVFFGDNGYENLKSEDSDDSFRFRDYSMLLKGLTDYLDRQDRRGVENGVASTGVPFLLLYNYVATCMDMTQHKVTSTNKDPNYACDNSVFVHFVTPSTDLSQVEEKMLIFDTAMQFTRLNDVKAWLTETATVQDNMLKLKIGLPEIKHYVAGRINTLFYDLAYTSLINFKVIKDMAPTLGLLSIVREDTVSLNTMFNNYREHNGLPVTAVSFSKFIKIVEAANECQLSEPTMAMMSLLHSTVPVECGQAGVFNCIIVNNTEDNVTAKVSVDNYFAASIKTTITFKDILNSASGIGTLNNNSVVTSGLSVFKGLDQIRSDDYPIMNRTNMGPTQCSVRNDFNLAYGFKVGIADSAAVSEGRSIVIDEHSYNSVKDVYLSRRDGRRPNEGNSVMIPQLHGVSNIYVNAKKHTTTVIEQYIMSLYNVSAHKIGKLASLIVNYAVKKDVIDKLLTEGMLPRTLREKVQEVFSTYDKNGDSKNVTDDSKRDKDDIITTEAAAANRRDDESDESKSEVKTEATSEGSGKDVMDMLYLQLVERFNSSSSTATLPYSEAFVKIFGSDSSSDGRIIRAIEKGQYPVAYSLFERVANVVAASDNASVFAIFSSKENWHGLGYRVPLRRAYLTERLKYQQCQKPVEISGMASYNVNLDYDVIGKHKTDNDGDERGESALIGFGSYSSAARTIASTGAFREENFEAETFLGGILNVPLSTYEITRLAYNCPKPVIKSKSKDKDKRQVRPVDNEYVIMNSSGAVQLAAFTFRRDYLDVIKAAYVNYTNSEPRLTILQQNVRLSMFNGKLSSVPALDQVSRDICLISDVTHLTENKEFEFLRLKNDESSLHFGL